MEECTRKHECDSEVIAREVEGFVEDLVDSLASTKLSDTAINAYDSHEFPNISHKTKDIDDKDSKKIDSPDYSCHVFNGSGPYANSMCPGSNLDSKSAHTLLSSNSISSFLHADDSCDSIGSCSDNEYIIETGSSESGSLDPDDELGGIGSSLSHTAPKGKQKKVPNSIDSLNLDLEMSCESEDTSPDGNYSDTFDCNASDSEDPTSYEPGGYHPVKIGEMYNERYRIEAKLGWGYFSTVWLATDFRSRPPCFVAIKFQRSAQNHTEAVFDEISLLKKVRDEVLSKQWVSTKPIYRGILGDFYNHTRGVVSYLNYFRITGPNGNHVCVVFEVMGPNVLSLIKLYKFQGIPIDLVRKITVHTLLGLDYLHRICGIIHTDLKPENILVTSPLASASPVIDVEACGKHKTPPDGDEVKGKNDSVADVPYLKNTILPRKSDPSLRTSYGDPFALQETLYRFPYHHIPWKLMESLKTQEKKAIDVNFYHPGTLKKMGLDYPLNGNHKAPIFIETQQKRMQLKPVTLDVFERKDAIFKICDLGNACWIDNHFTDEIQTRQYRAPEAILQCGYTQYADIWSLACIVFELITGDYLFDPRGADPDDRDANHLQLVVELLGPIPTSMLKESKKIKALGLRNINNIKSWPLESVLIKKYRMNPQEARELSVFLLCMLRISPLERLSADVLLQHSWLNPNRKENLHGTNLLG